MKSRFLLSLFLSSALALGQGIVIENDDSGDDQWISCAATSVFDNLPDGQAVTVSMWVNVSSTAPEHAAGVGQFVTKANASPVDGWFVGYQLNANAFLRVNRRHSVGALYKQWSPGSLLTDQWMHLYTVIPAGIDWEDVDLFRNGSAPTCCNGFQDAAGSYNADDANLLQIGADPASPSDRGMHGQIACVAIWVGAGSEEDADALYSIGRERCSPALFQWTSLGAPLLLLEAIGAFGSTSPAFVDRVGNCIASVNGAVELEVD